MGIVEAIVNVYKLYEADGSITGRARAFMATCLCFGTYLLASTCKQQRASRWLTPTLRNLVANYSVTIAIFLFTALAAFVFDDVGVETLAIPTEFAPTYNDTILGRRRDWLVN